MDITGEHPSVYIVALLSMVVQAALAVYVHLYPSMCLKDERLTLPHRWVIFACIASLEAWSKRHSMPSVPGSTDRAMWIARCDNDGNNTDSKCGNKSLGWGFVIYMGVTYIYTSLTIGNIVTATVAGGPFGCKSLLASAFLSCQGLTAL